MTEDVDIEIKHTCFLDSQGKVIEPLPAFAEDPKTLIGLYRTMVLTRTFDAKAIALQRTGRLGTYSSSLGQEAVTVGGGGAMLSEDVLAGTYREQGAQFMRGVTTVELFTYWGGDERGSNFAGPVNDFPISIPIGSHAPHAAGAALAFKLRDEQRAVLCVFGDGATSKGDVYEAMNLAGVWKLPLVFLVNNNQWAISLPRAAQTASRTLAHKAFACGFGGEQVDGNDVIAVRHAVAEALANARGGGGPRLIEALTYRLTDHTTADDASRYRDDETVGEFWKQEPLARLRNYLSESSGWTRENEEALIADCAAEIEKAAEEYLALAPASPETMFDYLYASLPKDLSAQRDEVLKKAAGDG